MKSPMAKKNQDSIDDKSDEISSVDGRKRGFLKKAGAAIGGLTFGSVTLSSSAGATHNTHNRSRGTVHLGEDTNILNMNRGNSNNNSPAIALDSGLSSANVSTNQSQAAVMAAPFPLGGSGKSTYSAWTGYEFVAKGNQPQLAHIISRGSIQGYLEAAGPATASVDVTHRIQDVAHHQRVAGGPIFSQSADLLTVDFNEEDNHLAQEVDESFRKRHTVRRLQPGHVYRVSVPLKASTVTKGGEVASNFHPDAEGLTGIFRGSGISAGLGGEGGNGLDLHEIIIKFP